jgi:hypothetical protein
MATRPVEILALPPKLHELFDGRVPHGAIGDAHQKEKDFLSRSLSAYALHKLGGASIEDAAKGIVDGGGDGGIDGIYFSPVTNTLWLTQAKYIHAGSGEPDLGEVTKFKIGIENLLEARFDAFAQNAKIVALLPQLEAALKNPSTQVRSVLCYSGLSFISEDRKHLFEALRVKLSLDQADGYFAFQAVNLTTLNDWVSGGDAAPGIESVDLEIIRPGYVTTPYETIYGLIPLERLKVLHDEYGARLVRANIRGFKGSTDVNDDIQKTLTEEAGLFHYRSSTARRLWVRSPNAFPLQVLRLLGGALPSSRLFRLRSARTTDLLLTGFHVRRTSRTPWCSKILPQPTRCTVRLRRR